MEMESIFIKNPEQRLYTLLNFIKEKQGYPENGENRIRFDELYREWVIGTKYSIDKNPYFSRSCGVYSVNEIGELFIKKYTIDNYSIDGIINRIINNLNKLKGSFKVNDIYIALYDLYFYEMGASAINFSNQNKQLVVNSLLTDKYISINNDEYIWTDKGKELISYGDIKEYRKLRMYSNIHAGDIYNIRSGDQSPINTNGTQSINKTKTNKINIFQKIIIGVIIIIVGDLICNHSHFLYMINLFK